jgi:hypothetical protein
MQTLMGADARGRWLLLIHRVPQDPSSRRAYVWRQLKQLGALYLQQAAAILPDRTDTAANLESLAARIREFGGEVSLLSTTSPSEEWDLEIRSRFNAARDAEYAELLENVERFEYEVRREGEKGRFTFAQLEDVEAEWEKLQRWVERIRARDFFTATAGPRAAAALQAAAGLLETFTASVYAREHELSGQES